MVTRPLVSVIIPVYNGESVVVAAIESMLNQTVEDIKIIVVDDASKDNTVSMIRETFNDHRIRIIEHLTNRGAAAARNTGILSSQKSEFIAFLDADDISLAHRVEAQLNYLDQNKTVGGVGSAVTLFGEENGSIEPLCSPEDVAASTMFTCEFLMPTMTFRNSAFKKLNGDWFRPEYGPNCDWELVARMVMNGILIGNLPEHLVRYRRWPQQMTARIVDTVDCPATRLRSEMLDWFGIQEHHHQDMSSHIMVSPCYWPIERRPNKQFTIEKGERWLKLLRDFNEHIAANCWADRKLEPDSIRKTLNRCEEQLHLSCAEQREIA